MFLSTFLISIPILLCMGWQCV